MRHAGMGWWQQMREARLRQATDTTLLTTMDWRGKNVAVPAFCSFMYWMHARAVSSVSTTIASYCKSERKCIRFVP